MKRTFFIIISLLTISLQSGASVTDSLGLARSSADTMEKLLQGRVSGVRVSATDGSAEGFVNVSIRGVNTLRGNSSPLWIVDGAPLSMEASQQLSTFWQYGEKGYTAPLSALSSFNIYDIESIEVLKNLSETSRYGSRGANGVIIVKTRNSGDGKFDLRWNSNAGINMASSGNPAFIHNHSFSLGSDIGRTQFNVSGFIRENKGVLGDGSMRGGAHFGFRTNAGKVFTVGMNSSFSINQASRIQAAAYYGYPSLTLEYRGIQSLEPYETSIDGWKSGYDDNSTTLRTTDDVFVLCRISKTIKWKTSVGLDFQTNKRLLWYGNETTFGLENNGVAGQSYSSLFSLNAGTELSYDGYVGSNHHITASAGAALLGDLNRYNTMAGNDFPVHLLRAKGLDLHSSTTYVRKYSKELTRTSLSAYAGYDYKNIFGISGGVTADDNPRYEEGFTFYPSANAFFDLGKLIGMKDSSFRLDGGYGVAGVGHYLPYFIFGNYTDGAFPEVSQDIACYYEGYNKVLSREWNIGVSGGFRNRIDAKLSFYSKTSDDRLDLFRFGRILVVSKGLWTNAAKSLSNTQTSTISNKGVEFELSASLIKRGNLDWRVQLNGAYNFNKNLKVDYYDSPTNFEGQRTGAFYGYIVDDSKTVVGEGIIGNPIPLFTGALNSSLGYGALSAEICIDGAAGFDILNLNHMMASHQLGLPSSNFVEKGDFARLSRVSIAYDINPSVKWIKGLKLSLSALNLLTLTRYSGYCPDVDCFGINNLSRGMDYGSYPYMRTVILGVALKF